VTGAAATPVFAHLLRMTNHRATFEHACLTEPRREHGYCTDDMARVLGAGASGGSAPPPPTAASAWCADWP
jgi:hypothetical protein